MSRQTFLHETDNPYSICEAIRPAAEDPEQADQMTLFSVMFSHIFAEIWVRGNSEPAALAKSTIANDGHRCSLQFGRDNHIAARTCISRDCDLAGLCINGNKFDYDLDWLSTTSIDLRRNDVNWYRNIFMMLPDVYESLFD